MNTWVRFAARARTAAANLEEGFLCLLLAAMILLACLQIALRTLFSSGLLWADPLLRYLVVWAGLFGAAIATKKGKHIAMDIASHLVPAGWRVWLQLAIHLFSTLVAGFLTWAALLFVRNDARFGGATLLATPSWVWNLVFPLAFGLITYRFFSASLADLRAITGRPES